MKWTGYLKTEFQNWKTKKIEISQKDMMREIEILAKQIDDNDV